MARRAVPAERPEVGSELSRPGAWDGRWTARPGGGLRTPPEGPAAAEALPSGEWRAFCGSGRAASLADAVLEAHAAVRRGLLP